MMTNLDAVQFPIDSAAIALARAGFRVFPLLPGEKRPAITRGVKDATGDLDRVRQWWSRGAWNIGIATGSRLVVIDCDAGKPWPYSDSQAPAGVTNGADMLVALAQTHDAIGDGSWMFDTMSVRTPSGGMHFYYELPPGVTVRNSAGKVAPWIDVRGEGGYVVGPWSRLTDVGDYHPAFGWETTRSADLGEKLTNPRLDRVTYRPKPIPSWLLDMITPATNSADSQEPVDEWQALVAQLDAPEINGDGSRWAAAALDGEIENVQTAVEGTRNHTLNKAAYSLGQIVAMGYLDESTVTDSLTQAAVQCGLSTFESQATIRSGLSAGLRSPREVSVG